jgi:hypothetical protein
MVDRLKRTIKLLCWIGAIFCICWLPLNLWNAILDSTKIGVSDTVSPVDPGMFLNLA